jgi:Fe-S cluster biogenesis protein NfuA
MKKRRIKKMFPFTDEDLQDPVNNYKKKISPMLARDGGAIELLDIKNAKFIFS